MHQSTFLAVLLALLSLGVSAAPLLSPRQQDSPFVGTEPSIVYAAGANTSSCDRSTLRWQVSVPTAALSDNLFLEFTLYNNSYYDIERGDFYSLARGGGPPKNASSSIQDGTDTVLQYPVRGDAQPGQPASQDLFKYWYLASPTNTSYVVSFSAYTINPDDRVWLAERNFTASVECATKWGNYGLKREAEVDYVKQNGAVSQAVKSMSVPLLALSALALALL